MRLSIRNESKRSGNRRRRARTSRPARLCGEQLESRDMLSVVLPNVGMESLATAITRAGLGFLLSQIPSSTLNSTPPDDISVVYHAFPQEANHLRVTAALFDTFLFLDERSNDIFVYRVLPAINDDLFEDFHLTVEVVAGLELPVAHFLGFDLPDVEAIVPNPGALSQFVPSGIQDAFAVVDKIMDIGFHVNIFGYRVNVTVGTILKHAIPGPVDDMLIQLVDMLSGGSALGGVQAHLLDGDDTADLSDLSGVVEEVYGGTGNDVLMGGGTDDPMVLLGKSSKVDPATQRIHLYGGPGFDTFVVNNKFNVTNYKVDGGENNDLLLVPGTEGNDIIRIISDASGQIQAIEYLTPSDGSPARNEKQTITLPSGAAGNFWLTFGGKTTSAISASASAATVAAALNALSSINGGVSVTGPDGGPWTVEFSGASLANQNQLMIAADGTDLTVTGGDILVRETTKGASTKYNEVQTITLPSGVEDGTFVLTFGGQTTAEIPATATVAAVRQALGELSSIGGIGNLKVTSPNTQGGPWTVEFVGSMAETDQPLIQAPAAQAKLVGLASGSSVSTATQGVLQENEKQRLVITGATGGTFTLKFDGFTTANIPYNASPFVVKNLVKQLASIGGGENIQVAGSPGNWVFEFIGELAGAAQSDFVVDTTALTGVVSSTLTEIQTAAAGTNEAQTVTIDATANGGTFTLTFDGEETAPIDFDASAAAVRQALGNLPTVDGSQNVKVTGSGPTWTVTFVNDLGLENQPPLTIDDSELATPGTIAVVTDHTGGAAGNEVQTISLPDNTDGGTFTLSFGGATTGPLAFDATAAQVQAALNALGTLNVVVSGDDGGPWEVEFRGAHSGTDVSSLISGDGSALHRTGLDIEVIEDQSGSDGADTTLLTRTTFSGLTNVEQLRINGLGGDDRLILDGMPAMSLGIFFDGGDGRDIVEVHDTGSGDLVVHREGDFNHSGSVTVGSLAPLQYLSAERVYVLPLDPITGATGGDGKGRLVVFDTDTYEHNETLPTSMRSLGLSEVPVTATIDPGLDFPSYADSSELPGDEDWYEFRAPKTGGFCFEVFFDRISEINGGAGLPGNGDLGIAVYNGAGEMIAHGRADNLVDDVEVTVSATFSASKGEVYHLRVRGGTEARADALSVNTYSVRLVEADVLGPQVFDPDGSGPEQAIQIVTAGVPNANYNLFGIKPDGTAQGPTPLVDGLLINVRDLLAPVLFERRPGDALSDVYPALDEAVAETVGNYRLVGDHNGIIRIESAVVNNNLADDRRFISAQVTAQNSTADLVAAGLIGSEIAAGDLVVFEDGTADPDLNGQIREITAFDSATGRITFSDPFLDLPQNGDSFTVLRMATATITLSFSEPLPDDRFTLTILDAIVDPAGNAFDGGGSASQPASAPAFPSGDGVSGGDFVARFTVDSRAEVGIWTAGIAYLDSNGSFTFDPENSDYTNGDLVSTLGFSSDVVFTGNFVQAAGATADGFDKMAVYGRVGGYYRWLVDFNSDGIPDSTFNEPAGFRNTGIPVAGNFDGNAANGDEVGVFTGSTWRFDRDHDFLLADEAIVASNMTGFPVVGDFDGDGMDDLATWNVSSNRFSLSLTSHGGGPGRAVVTDSFRLAAGYGFIGARERPVAADMDGDGIDDLGLVVADRAGMTSSAAEWYFLVSGGKSIVSRLRLDPWTPNGLVVDFCPAPFGNDLFAQFGDEFGVPLVGNFDPPVAADTWQPATAETTPSATAQTQTSTSVATQQSAATTETMETTPAETEETDTLAATQPEEQTAPEAVHLAGTAGNDVVVVMPASGVVQVNGVCQQFQGALVNVEFDGLEGEDTVTIVGTSADETAELWPDHCVFTGQSLSLRAANVESTIVVGGGGNDTATLYDSAGDDQFSATPDAATLQGDGFLMQALGYSIVNAFATQGGSDVAKLYDSALADCPDHLEAKVDSSGKWARVSNALLDYAAWAGNFELVEAFSSNPQDTKDVGSAVQFLLTHGYW